MSTYHTTSTGLTTTATILAVGVSAAYAAFTAGPIDAAQLTPDTPTLYLAAPFAITSLGFYIITLVFCLSTLNRDSDPQRDQELKKATLTLFLQGFTAVAFALTAIIGTLLGSFTPGETTDQQNKFTNAQNLQNQAVSLLEKKNTQAAAETSWQATKNATDALILARTGTMPDSQANTTNLLEALSQKHSEIKTLIEPYYQRLYQLHYICFQDNNCAPDNEKLIHETSEYITEAELLSQQ